MTLWPALVAGGLVLLELIALAGRRAWVHWKLGSRRALLDEALAALSDALAAGAAPDRPAGRTRRRAFRLAALELLGELAGPSREQLTRIAEEAGLVDDAMRTLRRSPRAFARRAAADELAEIRSPRAASALAAGLADRDPIVRVVCVRGLAWSTELDHVERMLGVLDRDARRAPGAAASATLALAASAPEPLAALQDNGRSGFARGLAALGLATVRDARVRTSTLAELGAGNVLLGSLAVHAIERVGGAGAAASLEQVLADADRDEALRERVALALSRIHAVDGAPR